jgi:hypothetical protein
MRYAFSSATLLLFLAAFMPASLASVSSITLGWDPSADPGVTGYKLYYGPACRSYTNAVQAGAATSAAATDLSGGTTYYFAVTAYDASGRESAYSSEVSYAVPEPNQPPSIDPIADVTIGENAGLQTIVLSGIRPGSTSGSETLNVTATSSNPGLIANPAVNYTSPNSTGSLSFTPAGSGIGTATITVTVSDSQSPTNATRASFDVIVNPPVLGQAPLTNLFALPKVAIRLPLYPPFTNGDQFSFSLAAGAPAGAAIQTKKGTTCLCWTPSSAQASTTNLIVVQVADKKTPALNTTEAVLVVVLDYVDAIGSWASVQAGQTCSVPIYLSSSDGVTNLVLAMDWFSDRFSNPSFSLAAPRSASASVENQMTNLVIHLQASAGQVLQGSNLVGQLNFQTAPGQPSTFVYMPWEVLSASKPDGALYANPVPEMERIVVVNDVPLMEPNSAAGTNMGLTFYGKVGASYQLQGLAGLGDQEAWQPLLSYSQTNIQQAVSVDTTQQMGFYRLLQQ